jgi:hypothetical protein
MQVSLIKQIDHFRVLFILALAHFHVQGDVLKEVSRKRRFLAVQGFLLCWFNIV